MQRRIQTSSTAPKVPVKPQADNTAKQERALDANNPFVTFTEWWSEADEKAYAEL